MYMTGGQVITTQMLSEGRLHVAWWDSCIHQLGIKPEEASGRAAAKLAVLAQPCKSARWGLAAFGTTDHITGTKKGGLETQGTQPSRNMGSIAVLLTNLHLEPRVLVYTMYIRGIYLPYHDLNDIAVYTMYIHGIYMVYTIHIHGILHIHGMYMVYTMYI
jgi:hypothetical protein